MGDLGSWEKPLEYSRAFHEIWQSLLEIHSISVVVLFLHGLLYGFYSEVCSKGGGIAEAYSPYHGSCEDGSKDIPSSMEGFMDLFMEVLGDIILFFVIDFNSHGVFVLLYALKDDFLRSQ